MDVCDWLRNYLRDAPHDVNDVYRAAAWAGYAKREVREAKLLCRIKTTQKGGSWFWSLPED